MIRKDGHVHSPFCPHGSTDTLENYIVCAIRHGFKEISFTEHAPLPRGFDDSVPNKDSAMPLNVLPSYLKACAEIKAAYSNKIQVNIGLEIDYIEGFEMETKEFLDEWGPNLDDAILSVHFLKPPNNKYICLDFDPRSFEELIHQCGSLESVYELYYKTLNLSIKSNLGLYKPTRIGHITLVRKFQKLFPRNFDDSAFIEDSLNTISYKNYSLDVNGAGLTKTYCEEVYPPIKWVKKAKELHIPLIYGSDAHVSKQLNQGIAKLSHFIDY